MTDATGPASAPAPAHASALVHRPRPANHFGPGYGYDLHVSTAPHPRGRDDVNFGNEDSPDISLLVDEAELFETEARNQVESLASSGAVNLNDSMISVRDTSVLELSSMSGVPSSEVDETLANLKI